MFPAKKIVWAGIALTLLTTGVLAQGIRRSLAGSDSNKAGVAGFVIKNEVKKMQETLREKGNYRGEIDGVLGLRTRASLRAYQKAEHLPITGQVDIRTAGRLGVRPESTWGNSNRTGREVGDRAGRETKSNKPSAGIRWAEARVNRTPHQGVSMAAAIEDSRKDDANGQRAEN